MRALTQRLRRRLRAITRAGSPQHCRLEALESRTLLSVSWAVDSNRTLQITSDDSVNSLRLGTHDGTNLELYYYDDAGIPYLDAHHDLVDMSTFDRINVQMGAGQYNYVTVVEGYSDWLPVSQPANIDVGGGGRPDNIMFFYTPVAKLSGDGVTGGLFSTGDPQVGTVSFKNTPSTHVIGGNVDTPAYFDCSAFTGQGLALFGTYGNDTLIGGTGSTSYFGGDGNDTIKVTGGHNPAYGGPGNDTYIGGPGDGGFQGEEGDDTFIHGTGRDGFDGGPGNNTAYATAPSGASTILLGTWVAGGASPGNTYVFFGDSFSNSFSLLNTQRLNVDAGAGVQDGIIPATPGKPYPDLGIAGIDPNLNLQITHLEPTVDAGPDASLASGGAFAASGSFRDIGDPGNAWTATVDYGDGTGPQPLAINPTVISTDKGPAHSFDIAHDYQAAGTYTVTVAVTDSEGDRGIDTRTVNVAHVADQNIQGMVWVDFNNDGNVDFGEKGVGGVPIALANSAGQTVAQTMTDANGLYVFNHVATDTYTIIESSNIAGYIEGRDSLGTITDSTGNTIGVGVGNATVQNVFSAIPIASGQNAINYNFGEQPAPGSAVSKGQAATMGFWQNKNGQALILRFSSIGNWLADTMQQTFGGLVNASPQQVATLYQQQFVLKDKLDAQVMATALSAYATDASLGGAQAAAYGFTVGAYGLGDSTWNIGANGAAFGVANNTTLTIMQILQDWDQDTLSLKSSKTIRQMAIDVFGGINAKGGI